MPIVSQPHLDLVINPSNSRDTNADLPRGMLPLKPAKADFLKPSVSEIEVSGILFVPVEATSLTNPTVMIQMGVRNSSSIPSDGLTAVVTFPDTLQCIAPRWEKASAPVEHTRSLAWDDNKGVMSESAVLLPELEFTHLSDWKRRELPTIFVSILTKNAPPSHFGFCLWWGPDAENISDNQKIFISKKTNIVWGKMSKTNMPSSSDKLDRLLRDRLKAKGGSN